MSDAQLLGIRRGSRLTHKLESRQRGGRIEVMRCRLVRGLAVSTHSFASLTAFWYVCCGVLRGGHVWDTVGVGHGWRGTRLAWGTVGVGYGWRGIRLAWDTVGVGHGSRLALRMHEAPLGDEATWDLTEVREGPQLVACQSASLGVAEEDDVDRRVVTRAVDTERPSRAGLADLPQAYVIVLHHEWWAKLGFTRGEHHRRDRRSRVKPGPTKAPEQVVHFPQNLRCAYDGSCPRRCGSNTARTGRRRARCAAPPVNPLLGLELLNPRSPAHFAGGATGGVS